MKRGRKYVEGLTGMERGLGVPGVLLPLLEGARPFSSAKLVEGDTTGGSGSKFRRDDIGRSSSCSRRLERAACTAAARAPVGVAGGGANKWSHKECE